MTSSKPDTSHPEDVESIDAIVTAAYRLISGKAGEPRDWARSRALFAPGARLIPTTREAGTRGPVDRPPQLLDVEMYIERVRPYFEQNGFYETEVARRVDRYDQIAQVFSTYESRHHPNDPEPFMRGINSIQLFNDGKRWWIVNIFWQQEYPEAPIPGEYLGLEANAEHRTPNAER